MYPFRELSLNHSLQFSLLWLVGPRFSLLKNVILTDSKIVSNEVTTTGWCRYIGIIWVVIVLVTCSYELMRVKVTLSLL